MTEKQKKINKLMDDTAKKLDALGVKYFIGVVDRQPQEADGGKAYSQANVTGEDMAIILDIALPTRQDAVNLGIWVGNILSNRASDNN